MFSNQPATEANYWLSLLAAADPGDKQQRRKGFWKTIRRPALQAWIWIYLI